MSLDRFPVGLEMEVSYPEFKVSLSLLSTTQLAFEIKQGPSARAEIVDINVMPLGNSLFAVSWQDKDGATVANIQDFDRQVVYSLATMPDGRLMRMIGAIDITSPSTVPQDDRPGRNRSRALHSAPVKSRAFADAPERQNDWRTRHG